jgi:hypothetical protein
MSARVDLGMKTPATDFPTDEHLSFRPLSGSAGTMDLVNIAHPSEIPYGPRSIALSSWLFGAGARAIPAMRCRGRDGRQPFDVCS